MIKKFLSAFLFILAFGAVYSQTILLAPVTAYDSQGKGFDVSGEASAPYFFALESKFYGGEVSFKKLSGVQVISSSDAQKLCRLEEERYVVYGYVQKNENCLFSNLKFYDSLEKKVLWEVFDAEDPDDFQRLFESLALKIDEKVRAFFEIKEETKEESLVPASYDLTGNLFYWSPVDFSWCKSLFGTAGFDAGAEYFFKQSGLVIKNRQGLFSGLLLFEYKFGFGNPDRYTSFYHSFVLKSSGRFTWTPWDEKSFYFGAGPFYEFDLLSVQKKYEDSSFHVQNQWGFLFESGAVLDLREDLSLTGGIEADCPVTWNSFVSLKVKLGVVWKPEEKKVGMASVPKMEEREDEGKEESPEN